jgi:hypothetical protein
MIICAREILLSVFNKFIASLLVSILLTIQSHGQMSNPTASTYLWSQPILLSPCDSMMATSPLIRTVGDTIHVLWYSKDGAMNKFSPADCKGIAYSHSYDGGKTFSAPTLLQNQFQCSNNRGMIEVSGDYVYIGYFAAVDSIGDSKAALLISSDAGDTWSVPHLINFPMLCTFTVRDSSVYLWAGYDTIFPGVGYGYRSAFLVSHDHGNTFDTLVRGVKYPPPSGTPNWLVATNGILHMTYQYGDSDTFCRVYYVRSSDGGYTWSKNDTVVKKVAPGINAQAPTIHATEGGTVCLVWNDAKYGTSPTGFGGTILFRKSTDNGATWLPEQIISEYGTAMFPNVRIKDSCVAIIWDGYLELNTSIFPMSPQGIQIRLSKDAGMTWCDIEHLEAPDDTLLLGNPVLDMNRNAVQAIWVRNTYVEPIKWDLREISFRQELIRSDGILALQQEPRKFMVAQNYPNPFNPSTTIHFELPHESHVSLSLYNVLGEIVCMLVDEQRPAGVYDVNIDGSGLASGVYYYRIIAGVYTQTRKMVLVR